MYEKEIEKGVALFNRRFGKEWIYQRGLVGHGLDMLDGCNCVLSRVTGYEYRRATQLLNLSPKKAKELGFDLRCDNEEGPTLYDWEMLTVEWERMIKSLRKQVKRGNQ